MKLYRNGQVPITPGMYFIFGDGGTGKTYLTKLFKGKKLLISFDLSTNPLVGDADTDILVLEHRDAPVIQKLLKDQLTKIIQMPDYQVIVLDNVTSLQNLVLANIDNASKDGRQNYQIMQLWFRELGMQLRESGKTIYATAHQIDNGANGITDKGRYMPDMNEKTLNAFTSMFDLVGRIYLDKGVRKIDLDPEKGNKAKNRLDDRKLINADELIEPKTTQPKIVKQTKEKKA